MRELKKMAWLTKVKYKFMGQINLHMGGCQDPATWDPSFQEVDICLLFS